MDKRESPFERMRDENIKLIQERDRYKTALEKAKETLAEVCNTRCYEMAMTKQALKEIETVLKGE